MNDHDPALCNAWNGYSSDAQGRTFTCPDFPHDVAPEDAKTILDTPVVVIPPRVDPPAGLWEGWPAAGNVTLDLSDQHGDYFIRNQFVIRAEARTDVGIPGPPVKVGAWLPVAAEMAADAPALRATVEPMLTRMMDRMLNPWKFPDRPAIVWSPVLFPRAETFLHTIRSRRAALRAFLTRMRGAWAVARGTADVYDPADW